MLLHKNLCVISMILLSFSLFGQVDTDCKIPPSLPVITEESNDCSNCSGCSNLPENPSWAQMEQDASGVSQIFGGVNGGGITQADIGTALSGGNYPSNFANNAFFFGNMISQNADIGQMVDCINVNCLLQEIEPIDLAAFLNFLNNMGPQQIQEFNQALSTANNQTPGYDYHSFLTNVNNQNFVVQKINQAICLFCIKLLFTIKPNKTWIFQNLKKN